MENVNNGNELNEIMEKLKGGVGVVGGAVGALIEVAMMLGRLAAEEDKRRNEKV